ncbi:MAG: hypothetical protein LBS50_10950 [Prevotellaceae bacterium]|jgi:hypothetical protein|nr:hypothetical protein [Prevotellaceae bacterium]
MAQKKRKKRSLGNAQLIAAAATPENLRELRFEALEQQKFALKVGLGAIGVIGAIIGTVFLVKYLNKTKTERDLEKTLNEIADVDGSKLTLSKAQALTYANKLHELMKGFGTSDEAQIEDIIINKAVTADDLRLIVQQFGVKPYGTFGEPMFGSGTLKDLMGWIKEEIGGAAYSRIAAKFTSAGLFL